MKKKKKEALKKDKKGAMKKDKKGAMKKAMKNVFFSIVLLVTSITLFFLSAEWVTRFKDKRTSGLKVHADPGTYDDIPRLQGYEFEKKPGVFRILVLGDSVAWGQGVRNIDTFSKRLETMLNEGTDKGRFEVINTGFLGINTMQELFVLLDKGPFPNERPELAQQGWQGLAYDPDLILLQYTLVNDAQNWEDIRLDPRMALHGQIRFDGTLIRRKNWGPYALPLPLDVDKWLTQNSRFYMFFLNKYHGFLTRLKLRDEEEKIRMMYEPNRRGWQYTKSALKKIGLIAKYRNNPAVFVNWASSNNKTFKDIRTLLSNTASEYGFHALDLAEAVEWPAKDLAVSKSDGHPNAEAHDIAATAIYKFLKEKKLVPEG